MDADERRAVLGLWGVQGLGPRSLGYIRARHDLATLLDVRPSEWCNGIPELAVALRETLDVCPLTLRELAELQFEGANLAAMKVCFPGDLAYPRGLADIPQAPPVLYYWGRGDRPNAPRRLAMIGSRKYEPNYTRIIDELAFHLAARVIVVSGAAVGVDELCHRSAIRAGGETWAFMGAGLDELDRPQAELAPAIVDSGGTVFSQFPPRARAAKDTFLRRNPSIAGASDAVLLLRAGPGSGATHTALHGADQRKPLFAMPGQIDHHTSVGPNRMIRKHAAVAICSALDVFEEMGLVEADAPAPSEPAVDLTSFTPGAQRAYALLTRIPVDFDQLLAIAAPMNSGQLVSALVELQLAGVLRERPGKLYERA